jgi:hypothetical protein
VLFAEIQTDEPVSSWVESRKFVYNDTNFNRFEIVARYSCECRANNYTTEFRARLSKGRRRGAGPVVGAGSSRRPFGLKLGGFWHLG